MTFTFRIFKFHIITKICLAMIFCICSLRLTAQSSTTRVQIVSFEQLQTLMQPHPDTVRVINFWATTCPPCIAEMPSFDRFHREYSVSKESRKVVQVVFVSLDFKRDIQSKVIPFAKKRGFGAKIMCLGPPKSTEIDGIDISWSGAIPATLIIGTKARERTFYEGKMEYDELKNATLKYVLP